jgi:hypothetical protein
LRAEEGVRLALQHDPSRLIRSPYSAARSAEASASSRKTS